jgi:predicted amidohydrolase YtcJ
VSRTTDRPPDGRQAPTAVATNRLLALLPAVPGLRPPATGPDPGDGCVVSAWAAWGLPELSGPPVVARVAGLIEAIAAVTEARGRAVRLDPGWVLGRRAALRGWTPAARTSMNGTCRLLAAADGWVAVSLSRPEDLAAVPAITGRSGGPPWDALAAAAAERPAAALAAAAQLLGVPAAALGVAAALPPLRLLDLPAVRSAAGSPVTTPAATGDGPAARPTVPADQPVAACSAGVGEQPAGGGEVVLDLSALWAGPLCAYVLGQGGADVVTVADVRRPGPPERPGDLLAELRAGHRRVVLDLSTPAGRAELAALADAATVVIEASRPRALRRFGLRVEEWLRPGRTWVSITGYGRADPDQRVAFGDDAAVAGGLVATAPDGTPVFVGDAIADPLTGLYAALAAAACAAAGGGRLVDVAMAGVSADVARPAHGAPAAHPPHRDRDRTARRGRSDRDRTVLVTGAEVGGRPGLDVLVDRHRVLAVGAGLDRRAAGVVLAAGGAAVLPGLHDHHVHLRAAAAARGSVRLDRVADPAGFDRALRVAAAALPGGGWLRATGWYEGVAGEVDRHRLDRLVPGRPVRVQHRGGALWVLNSAALARVGAAGCDLAGVERGADGSPTGRLWRLDGWLRDRIGSMVNGRSGRTEVEATPPRAGVTGFTDATPDRTQSDVDTLAGAGLPQRLLLLAPPGPRLPGGAARVRLGATKVVLDDSALPPAAELAALVADTHRRGRPVAVHCVTAEQLVLATAAVRAAGPRPGDRIEHAGVVPPGYADQLAALGLAVVTQPGFLAGRGDDYLRAVPPTEQPWLYPCRSLRAAGVAVAGGTDAPFGPADPWAAMTAAVHRRTASGRVVGAAERVGPAAALRLFLADPEQLGRVRRVAAGASGDLCVLRVPLAEALRAPARDLVRAVVCAGRIVGADS